MTLRSRVLFNLVFVEIMNPILSGKPERFDVLGRLTKIDLIGPFKPKKEIAIAATERWLASLSRQRISWDRRGGAPASLRFQKCLDFL